MDNELTGERGLDELKPTFSRAGMWLAGGGRALNYVGVIDTLADKKTGHLRTSSPILGSEKADICQVSSLSTTTLRSVSVCPDCCHQVLQTNLGPAIAKSLPTIEGIKGLYIQCGGACVNVPEHFEKLKKLFEK